jgi:predicted DNA-binding protein
MQNKNYKSTVIVKMTNEMKEKLEEKAKENYITTSEYIRNLINEKIQKES